MDPVRDEYLESPVVSVNAFVESPKAEATKTMAKMDLVEEQIIMQQLGIDNNHSPAIEKLSLFTIDCKNTSSKIKKKIMRRRKERVKECSDWTSK